MDVTATVPGISGLFTAGIIGAALRCVFVFCPLIFCVIMPNGLRDFQYYVSATQHCGLHDLRRFHCENVARKSFRVYCKHNHEIYRRNRGRHMRSVNISDRKT